MTRDPVHSPVLLLGAGTGEATCGILYLAGYLRRGGIEAYVRLYDDDVDNSQMARSLAALVGRTRPRLVGISLKWFHHVHRAMVMARALRKIDPTLRIVVGGNSATHWWRELLATGCFDDVVLGDGELPLLALCRGEAAPPNCVNRADRDGPRPKLTYVQGLNNSDEVSYSHFDQIFLSQRDRHAFSGWVAPGKGCAESCMYCAGARKNQQSDFGRVNPYLRTPASVQRDHTEIAPRTWQLRYDFSGSSVEFLRGSWADVDLSGHSCTYFLWGVPQAGLVDALARTFAQVHVVIDVGCFSQQQRHNLIGRGILKACASDDDIFRLVDECRRHDTLDIEIAGIAGLPMANADTLREELRLVERVLSLDCVLGYQRLEAQPGALVTEQPARFDMRTEARTFEDFLRYFERREPGRDDVPMIRFADAALEAEVTRTADQVGDRVAAKARTERRRSKLTADTRLVNTAPATKQFTLGAWLGSEQVPAGMVGEPVTVVRSVNGAELACAPTIGGRRPVAPTLEQGETGRLLLATLAAFAQPTTVARAVKEMGLKARLGADEAHQAIAHLAEGKFLQPVRSA
jgi:B12 binding domain